ncbi:zinc finger BED domain-containing protein 4-like [Mercenaria mercenaria]|uniref:zinc finger BED domain-containing protein 4-like n=1 Tax=Mercenaria mercenaria TaxID=6596 RepID=UPI00234F2FC2|nr:zinc finger BED domain-containing protein 4-like [Mercenaria mercenaria]
MNVLKHFDVPEGTSEDKNKKFQAKCMYCAKHISGSLKITSNFITHIKGKHSDVSLEKLEPSTCTSDQPKIFNPTESDTEDNNLTEPDIEEEETGFKHMRCYAHTLQLVVRDGLRDCSLNILKVIAKVSKIAGHIRKSVAASDLLQEENRVQTANATRWNSQLVMIKSILNIPEEKLNLVEYSLKLTSYERKLLSEICKILSPFELATNMIQNDKTVSASMTIPVTIGLKRHLKNVQCDYNSNLVKRLRESTEQRMSIYEEEDTFVTAAILDPRFKLTWCEPDQTQRYTTNLKQKVIKHIPNFQEDEQSSLSKRTKLDQEAEDFFSFLPSTPKRSRNPSGSGEFEVDEYLNEECIDRQDDPLQYWKKHYSKYPTLAELAVRFLAIPAASAPVERLFSIAGKIFRPDRNRLNDQIFEQLMFIKCNSDKL